MACQGELMGRIEPMRKGGTRSTSRSTRPLSGAAKDAYLKRAVAAESTLSTEQQASLTERLKADIASLTLRALAQEVTVGADADSGEISEAPPAEVTAAAADAEPAVAFDPYSPNVIVVVRRSGREAALEELGRIEDVASLRLLAREQQLGIAPELTGAAEIRAAIVAAAERRIANRRAAAS
jgi:hypothetical protein